jgi:hypothetical protein
VGGGLFEVLWPMSALMTKPGNGLPYRLLDTGNGLPYVRVMNRDGVRVMNRGGIRVTRTSQGGVRVMSRNGVCVTWASWSGGSWSAAPNQITAPN